MANDKSLDPNDSERWKSLNQKTGMVEGMEDARTLILKLSQLLAGVLTHPMIEFLMPEGVRMDYALLTVGARSMAEFISEADFMRQVAVLSGQGREAGELIVLMSRLSETLPSTHPSIERHHLSGADIAGITPMGSMILDDILKQEQDRLAKEHAAPLADAKANAINETKQERVELPPALNDFLNSIQREDKSQTPGSVHDQGPPEKR